MPVQSKIIKVLVTGTRGSGKSSIICRFIYDNMDGCSQDEGAFYRSGLINIDNSKFSFILKEVRNLPTTENTAGFIVVLDPTRESDIKEVPFILENIGNKKIVIALNKADMKYLATFWVEDVMELVKGKIKIIPVSAKTGENINDLFLETARMVNK
mgnify:CR=1 FL=1